METFSDLTPTAPSGAAVGYLSNGGTQRYLLEAESTTGYVAWKLADGTTLTCNAMEASLVASPSIWFWSCAGHEDATPAGNIISFDCHGNALSHLDVRALTALEYLDCSFNNLTQLPLDGLTELQAIDADNNRLKSLEVRDLHALRELNCTQNQLQTLDLSGLAALEILDCSQNQLSSLILKGCTALRECKSDGNVRDLERGRKGDE